MEDISPEPNHGARSLDGLLCRATERNATRIALEQNGKTLSYEELARAVQDCAAKIAKRFSERRLVGWCATPSLGSIVALHAILRSGAAYLALDPQAPPMRTRELIEKAVPDLLILDRVQLERQSDSSLFHSAEPLAEDLFVCSLSRADDRLEPPLPDELSSILFTSGSTGEPKGVMHTHRSTLSFVDACCAELSFEQDERIAGFSPPHFDLSSLELFVGLQLNATTVLVPDAIRTNPVSLADFLVRERISVFYATPTTLRLLERFGRLEGRDFGRMRRILFAGEVLSWRALDALRKCFPAAEFVNLYGPTETNVCTSQLVDFEVPRQHSHPALGHVWPGFESKLVQTELESSARPGSPRSQAGELAIRGRGLMAGYVGLPPGEHLTQLDGEGWYLTGDWISEDEGGTLQFVERRDRMIKRRGFRVELAEVERLLSNHPDVQHVAVTAVPDELQGAKMSAFVSVNAATSPFALRQYAGETFPQSLVPDSVVVVDRLPQTSSGKVDYQRLHEWAETGATDTNS